MEYFCTSSDLNPFGIAPINRSYLATEVALSIELQYSDTYTFVQHQIQIWRNATAAT